MDWKLYLFISSLKRLSMKCADRAFTLLLSILITFSTESLPSAISSCMVNGAFWWWKLWMPFLAPHRLCPLPCVGNLKGAIQAARRFGAWAWFPERHFQHPGGVLVSNMGGSTSQSSSSWIFKWEAVFWEVCVKWAAEAGEGEPQCKLSFSGDGVRTSGVTLRNGWTICLREESRWSKHYTIWTTERFLVAEYPCSPSKFWSQKKLWRITLCISCIFTNVIEILEITSDKTLDY